MRCLFRYFAHLFASYQCSFPTAVSLLLLLFHIKLGPTTLLACVPLEGVVSFLGEPICLPGPSPHSLCPVNVVFPMLCATRILLTSRLFFSDLGPLHVPLTLPLTGKCNPSIHSSDAHCQALLDESLSTSSCI